MPAVFIITHPDVAIDPTSRFPIGRSMLNGLKANPVRRPWVVGG
jgi:hypothetical protein